MYSQYSNLLHQTALCVSFPPTATFIGMLTEEQITQIMLQGDGIPMAIKRTAQVCPTASVIRAYIHIMALIRTDKEKVLDKGRKLETKNEEKDKLQMDLKEKELSSEFSWRTNHSHKGCVLFRA